MAAAYFGHPHGDNLKENATGLSFQPRLRAVVTCDYTGFVEPEMVKVRSVVVLSKSKTNDRLITVVPLSTTPPDKVLQCHHKLSRNPHPDENPELAVWAKCDMVYTVSLARVNYYKTKPRRGGRATYHSTLMISPDDFLAIQKGARYALGLNALPDTTGEVVAQKAQDEVT
ncbi:type II toxin-antitoxin system PemK/MazF family toxin [Paraburkholderia ribeironis]|nr:type II toxin-antitoxin system PemK/MazF family toxin [Paraburkholderia ribeironis]